jgi:uncharacterized protein YtpQ (UPF0354 family)
VFNLFRKKSNSAPTGPEVDFSLPLDTELLERIVPVVKVVEHAESEADLDTNQKLVELGEDDSPVSRVLAGDLIVMYAEDRDDCFAYLTKKRMRELGLNLDDLHDLAVENLPCRVPNIQVHGDGHSFMITAGGNFEASLLLHPTLWDGLAEHLAGFPIAVVPARDLLFVAGSESEQGRAFIKEKARLELDDKRHALSTRVLIRKDGAWSVSDLSD